MGNLEAKSKVSLYKEHLLHKYNLVSEVSVMQMRSTYYRTNLGLREIKELQFRSKIIRRRLQETVATKLVLKGADPKQLSLSIKDDAINSSYVSPIEVTYATLIDIQKEEEDGMNQLKQKLGGLLKNLINKKSLHSENEKKINGNSSRISELKNKQLTLKLKKVLGRNRKPVIADTNKVFSRTSSTQDSFFQSIFERKTQNKSEARTDYTQDSLLRSTFHRRNISNLPLDKSSLEYLGNDARTADFLSLRSLKSYIKLSESRASLMSKLSLRSVMKQSIESTEKELNKKYEVAKRKVKKIKSWGLDRNMPNIYFESKAELLAKKILKLEKELWHLKKEMDSSAHIDEIEIDTQLVPTV